MLRTDSDSRVFAAPPTSRHRPAACQDFELHLPARAPFEQQVVGTPRADGDAARPGHQIGVDRPLRLAARGAVDIDHSHPLGDGNRGTGELKLRTLADTDAAID